MCAFYVCVRPAGRIWNPRVQLLTQISVSQYRAPKSEQATVILADGGPLGHSLGFGRAHFVVFPRTELLIRPPKDEWVDPWSANDHGPPCIHSCLPKRYANAPTDH